MEALRVGVYYRCSTDHQDTGLDSQRDALMEFCRQHNMGPVEEYNDIISGATTSRPGLDLLKRDIFLGKINCVVVWRLDRLSRSLLHGVTLLCEWLERGVRIIAINQQFDFNGAVGKLIASVLFAVADMERQTIRDNVKRGLARARANGKVLGGSRPGRRVKLTNEKIAAMVQLYSAGNKIKDIAATVGLHRNHVAHVLTMTGTPRRNHKLRTAGEE